MATHEVTRPLALNVTALEIAQALQDVIVTAPVVDNLTTNDGSKALSAKMGKKLNDEKFPIANIASALGQDVDKVPSNKVVDDAINAIISTSPVAEWESGHTYAIGDYCMHNGYLYRSITNGSHEGWHDVYFEVVTLKSNRDVIRSMVTLLWTNPSPGDTFSAQNIPLDLTPYSFVLIITYGLGSICKSVVGLVGTSVGVIDNDNTLRYRSFTINSNGISVSSGHFATTYDGSVADSNGVAKPYKIYGIKL